ncbi:MAG: hypothetical protein ABI960_08910, partial [Candidatus Eisenbacteria bacterium]
MSTALADLKLGVGVAAYEHDAHLGRTLEAVDAVLAEAGVVPLVRVVAAADGSFAAERIAAEHGWSFRRIAPGIPPTLSAAREAARRAAGGAAQLLIDGDVALQAGWLADAVALLREHEHLAGVSGAIDEAHWRGGALVGGRHDVYGTGDGGAVALLRDAALLRRSALDAVGGFDSWLPSEAEAELGARLLSAGFVLTTLGSAVAVRHGVARDSFGEVREFLRDRRMSGPGLVLRRARGTMAFPRHVARYRAALLLLLWAIAGGVTAVIARDGGPVMVWLWASAGLLMFFSVLRQSVPRAIWRGARAFLVAVSVVRTLAVPIGLPRLGTPPRPIAPPRE